MKSAILALAAVASLFAMVDAAKIVCRDLITDPKVIDNGPLIDFKFNGIEILKGAFFINRNESVYRMNADGLQVHYNATDRELNLRDEKCGCLKLHYKVNEQDGSFKAVSAQLLLRQPNRSLAPDCSVRDPELYFKPDTQYKKQSIDCLNDAGAIVDTLIINKLRIDLTNFFEEPHGSTTFFVN